MEDFSGVQHWWLFPFENLIGKLQRIPHNHKPGEREHTMLEYFWKSAFFRQWLMRPDSPPLLQYCLELLDKAYHFYKPNERPEDSANEDDKNEVEDPSDDDADALQGTWNSSGPEATRLGGPTPPALTALLGTDNIDCFGHIPAAKGHYTIPRARGIGNSYVCFQPDIDLPDGKWAAGQIQHIFKDREGGPMKVAIRHSMQSGLADPFASFWDDGFEAKLVSSEFSEDIEIIDASNIIAHTARWSISAESVVVLNLSMYWFSANQKPIFLCAPAAEAHSIDLACQRADFPNHKKLCRQLGHQLSCPQHPALNTAATASFENGFVLEPRASAKCQKADWTLHKPSCKSGNSTKVISSPKREAALAGSKKFVRLYFSRILARTISPLSAAIGRCREAESVPQYISRLREFAQNNVVTISVQLKDVPEYHHRDFYYIPNSATIGSDFLYQSTNRIRQEHIASHSTESEFGFAMIVRVLDHAGNLLVWWSKVDTIPIAALFGILAANTEEELRGCGRDTVICPWWEIRGSAANFTIHNLSAALDYKSGNHPVGVQFECRVNFLLYLFLHAFLVQEAINLETGELDLDAFWDILASLRMFWRLSLAVTCPWWEIGGSAANFMIHNLSAALDYDDWQATLPPSIHSKSPTQRSLRAQRTGRKTAIPMRMIVTRLMFIRPIDAKNRCPTFTPVGEMLALSPALANFAPVLPILPENILVLASAASQKTVHFPQLSYQLSRCHVIFDQLSGGLSMMYRTHSDPLRSSWAEPEDPVLAVIKKLIFFSTPNTTLCSLPLLVEGALSTSKTISSRLSVDHDVFSKSWGLTASHMPLAPKSALNSDKIGGGIQLLDAKTGQVKSKDFRGPPVLGSVALSTTNETFVSWTDESFQLFRLVGLELLQTFATGRPMVYFPRNIVFGEQDRIVVGGTDQYPKGGLVQHVATASLPDRHLVAIAGSSRHQAADVVVFQKFIKKDASVSIDRLDWQHFSFYLPRKLVQLMTVINPCVGIWAGISVARQDVYFSIFKYIPKAIWPVSQSMPDPILVCPPAPACDTMPTRKPIEASLSNIAAPEQENFILIGRVLSSA
ncbi:hypothetical protein BT96DRAFT_1008037 [Gymnopus androsaceus JB14]|uniref:Uncharacterized protein n=1 Tax=Gymnopus androsaceus JB14 TaxID=1447944 RepID=A0A6A4GGK5_9AGAR|nr:hypothetical protein BT96DRAFT_1008037 [Gymnopus androsaceus JB14]